MRTIYDFGSNNGDDIPYYLLRAEQVIAVEANPALCKFIGERFADDIAAGRLHVENCVLTGQNAGGQVPFHVNKANHVRSQLERPADMSGFEHITVKARSASSIVAEHGAPHYIKIDLEGCDGDVLDDLFSAGIRPPYISVEAHSVDVFCQLVAKGGYNAFKLVDGSTVSTVYRNRLLETEAGQVVYSFPDHAAGPFGQDIDGEWRDADRFFIELAEAGLGWKDIHATNIHQSSLFTPPKPGYIKKIRRFANRIQKQLTKPAAANNRK